MLILVFIRDREGPKHWGGGGGQVKLISEELKGRVSSFSLGEEQPAQRMGAETPPRTSRPHSGPGPTGDRATSALNTNRPPLAEEMLEGGSWPGCFRGPVEGGRKARAPRTPRPSRGSPTRAPGAAAPPGMRFAPAWSSSAETCHRAERKRRQAPGWPGGGRPSMPEVPKASGSCQGMGPAHLSWPRGGDGRDEGRARVGSASSSWHLSLHIPRPQPTHPRLRGEGRQTDPRREAPQNSLGTQRCGSTGRPGSPLSCPRGGGGSGRQTPAGPSCGRTRGRDRQGCGGLSRQGAHCPLGTGHQRLL